MKAVIFVTLVLLLATGSGRAERKPLDKIHREIKPGATVVAVPNPKRRDGYEYVEKKHEVTYDAKTELYTYRYWQTDSTYVDLLYEPSNRLDVTVACTVVYDEKNDEYTYTYHLDNSKDSVQPLVVFALDIDRNLVLRTEIKKTWYYFSTGEPPPGSPKWAFWGELDGPVLPGESISLTLVSKLGPIIATCYSKGSGQTFIHSDHPDLEIDELGVPPTNKEGLKGQTLAPGSLRDSNPKAQFEAFLDVAETWGWVNQDKKDAALLHISKDLDQTAFIALKNELNLVQGKVEGEVTAFLEHLGKDQGFSDE